ncbi:DUF421 domain-containing protein [Brevibacillus sp. WF146]|uniref:DUF421 domain-containing protein n=1 Tax=Brevibacillus sp. WF146 TaxID=319501 RepID=UPI0007ED5C73|nr:DUF421 domain-containing protein [Brevibacillus sp. WF146]UYZ14783.1 DUF421 domain-containing protein [Brevibacillus sp. WF146]
MDSHIFDIVLRSVLAFAIIMVIARTLGKPTVAQLTYHDFVATITLGAITANLTFNKQTSVWELITALLTFSGIAYFLMYLALKNRTLRKWFSGQPTVLIQDGKILENNMRKLKLTLDTLNQELREKNIFNLEEVQYAVLELNGKISVLRKPKYLPVTRKDLKLKPNIRQYFPIELIMDGQIIEDNLKDNGITKEWLLSQVRKRGLSIEKINYAVKSSNGSLYIDPFEDHISQPIDQE